MFVICSLVISYLETFLQFSVNKIVELILNQIPFVGPSVLQCTNNLCLVANMISTPSHNKYRIQALSDYVYICRGLYLHSIIKLVVYSQKKRCTNTATTITKIQDRRVRSQMFCFCTKYSTCETRYKWNQHEMNIHIINYGLWNSKEFKYSFFGQFLRIQAALV